LSEKYFRGKIVSINNDKKRATIEYVNENKIRSIVASIDQDLSNKKTDKKPASKAHRFLIGDQVKFVIKKSSSNQFFADHLVYEFNNGLDVLINKAKTENRFLGYVKKVEEDYFIKEIDSYFFFPMRISKFEIAPEINENDKPVYFKLTQIENPEKISAALYNHQYIPGFSTAMKQYKKEEPIAASVERISPHGIFVELVDSKMKAKINRIDSLEALIENETIKAGAEIQVIIRHMNADRIVIEYSDAENTEVSTDSKD
jgi:hypothetical protein